MQQTLEKMKHLRLLGMYEAYKTTTAQAQSLSLDEWIALLIEAEWQYKQQRKIKRLTTKARFRYHSSFNDIDYQTSRALDKNLIARLASCQFITKAENVLICGPTGVGKSYIASALGHQACLNGYKTLYFNSMKLFAILKTSKADASYVKLLRQIESTDLLIIDDFGLQTLEPFQRNSLMEIIEDRHNRKSTIIASQLPVKNWYDVIGESTIADAILDRLIYAAHRIELQGESMRKMKKNV
jgi:DNA replication protein DnaC